MHPKYLMPSVLLIVNLATGCNESVTLPPGVTAPEAQLAVCVFMSAVPVVHVLSPFTRPLMTPDSLDERSSGA